MKNGDPRDYLDLLRHIESLAEEINNRMALRSRSIVRRYPVTFALLALVGIVAVSEGIKGFLEQIPYLQNSPLTLLFSGLVILAIVGSLYKKLK
jgi:hypothetical protein